MERRIAVYLRTHSTEEESYQEYKTYLSYLNTNLPGGDAELFWDKKHSWIDENRPQYNKMISGINSGKFTHVVARSCETLNQNIAGFHELMNLCTKKNVDIILIEDNYSI